MARLTEEASKFQNEVVGPTYSTGFGLTIAKGITFIMSYFSIQELCEQSDMIK